jgi:hypothetical protein
MKNINYDSLLERIKNNPEKHLDELCIDSFEIYIFGYNLACEANKINQINDPIDIELFEKFIKEKYRLFNNFPFNVKKMSILNIVCDSHEKAIIELINIRNEAISKNLLNLNKKEDMLLLKNKSFIEYLLDDIKQRPGMFMGNNASAGTIWTLVQGYLWCEKDYFIQNSDVSRIFKGFQKWHEERYLFSINCPWFRVLNVFALHSKNWSIDFFYDNLILFLSGEKPDTASMSVLKIIEGIEKNTGKKVDIDLKSTLKDLYKQ